MDPEDNSYSRVSVDPVLALDAHCEGDIFLPLRESDFHGYVRCATELPNQVALLYTLIEYFGPNQVVGVPPFGNPRENLSFARLLFPETLQSCLALLYILRFILIHRYLRALSLPATLSLKCQIVSSSKPLGRHVAGAIGGLFSTVTGTVQTSSLSPKKGL